MLWLDHDWAATVPYYWLFGLQWNPTMTLPNTSAQRNAGKPVATGQISIAKSNDVGKREESHHDVATANNASKKVPNARALEVIKADALNFHADLASSIRRWQ